MDKILLSKVIENRNLLEVLNDPAYIVGKSKELLYYNYNYYNLTGLSPRELKSKRICHECFSLDICSDNCLFDRCSRVKQPIQLRDVAARDKNGNLLSFWVTAVPLFGETDSVEAMLVFLRDMTAETGSRDKYKILRKGEKGQG